jgi:prenyltransferase beta subunit
MSRRTVVAGVSVALATVLTGSLGAPADAATTIQRAVAERGVAYLAAQQRSDGGFGPSEDPAGQPYAGFETPDAVLGIAEAAQSTLAYDAAAGLAAVRSIRKDGHDGLHYLDDVADAGVNAGKAAQLVLVAKATAQSITAFDPDADGATDLVANIDAGRQGDGSYGTFGETLLVTISAPLVGRPADARTVDLIRRAQQDDGGFNYAGDRDPNTAPDVDTTARAVEALVAAGATGSDPAVSKAIAFLAANQNADGGFAGYGGSSSVNSTAVAILAIEAAGYSVDDACWRTTHGASTKGYVPPFEYLRKQQRTDGAIAEPDAFDAAFATAQGLQGLLRAFEPVARSERQPCPTNGYRLVAADGGVFTHGSALFAGSTGDRKLNRPIVASAATPSGNGYWLFASDGGVFTFGDAEFHGSTGDLSLNSPIVGAAATPTGGGYWLFASDGGVFAFGDAAFLGSEGGAPLNKPIVAGEATADGRGYWLFASDGGVFTHGDAAFAGSTGAIQLNKPIVAAAASRQGGGYWLFASDGGVFSFGDAAFAGSAGDVPLNKPIVTGFRSGGDGYYLVASDGGVFAYGDAPFLGSEGATPLNSPIVAASR